MIGENNAIITGYSLRIECGALTLWLNLKYGDHRCQGFGGWALQTSDKDEYEGPAGYYIYKVLQICGVDDLSKVVGKAIRVTHDDQKVYSIGNIIEDSWFNPVDDLFNKMKK